MIGVRPATFWKGKDYDSRDRTSTMINFLSIGIIFGLSAGLAPGPLLTLVISETLQHDIKSGVKVALAPIITDLPIVVLTIFVLAKLSNFHNILGIISLTGAFVILFMGYENIRSEGVALNIQTGQEKSLTRGILTNALNPHPYLFWFSVGAPIITKALNVSVIAPVAFICSFYISLVGSKIILAFVVARSRSFLSNKVYIYIIRCLGMVLCLLAFVLLRDSLRLLGVM
jgi:threonine/homoserine/homoserine lactone efflux protein